MQELDNKYYYYYYY